MFPKHEDFFNEDIEESDVNNEVVLEHLGLSPEANTIIFKVLTYINRGAYYHLFKDNPESLPLIANMLNYLAKTTPHTEEMYADKKIMMKELLKEHPRTWESNGVQYSETPFGQVSFHVFGDEPYTANTLKFGINPENRAFSGENLQEKALSLIDTYIEEAVDKDTAPKI